MGCQETCGKTNMCVEPPTEGCICEENYVQSDQECVLRSECGCKLSFSENGKNNTEYFPVSGLISILMDIYVEVITLSQMTIFRPFQIERVCR